MGTIATGTWNGTAIADDYISSAGTWNGKQAALTFGIANTNAVKIDAADVADDDYARFTSNGLEGRTAAQLKSDLNIGTGDISDLSSWTGNSSITSVGDLTSLTVDGNLIVNGNTTLGDASSDTVTFNAKSGSIFPSGTVTDNYTDKDLGSGTVGWDNIHAKTVYAKDLYVGGGSYPTSAEFTKSGSITSGTITIDDTVPDTTEIVEYTVHFKNSSDHVQVSKALIMTVGDGTNTAYIQEYAIMYSNFRLADLTADVSGNNIRLRATVSASMDYVLSRKTVAG